MTETYILVATFVGVLIFSTVMISRLARGRQLRSRLSEAAEDKTGEASFLDEQTFSELQPEYHEKVKNYYDVVRNDQNTDSLRNRLIRAGYFSPNALFRYQVLRIIVSATALTLAFLFIDYFFPAVAQATAIFIAMFVSAFVFFLCNVILERMGVSKERKYRRLFPDFMDMLIVCVDAGLSVEAAVDRVAREFMSTHQDFGMHLSIMMLEVRGGRRLRDALSNFADRLQIEEAKSLAILFRQSEELGSSVTKSLRVYSNEMRQTRVLRAEEKANALPIKMLFPLATFLFPMSLIIVLVPIMMRLGAMLLGLSPGR